LEAERARAAVGGGQQTPDPQGGQQQPQPQVTTQDLTALVQKEAQKLAARERFNEKADAVYASGKEKFGDQFDASMQNLVSVGALGPDGNPNFSTAVTELDQGAVVLNHLGSNPDECARILALPATKMAVELTKLEQRLTAPKPSTRTVSQAPNPITTVQGSA